MVYLLPDEIKILSEIENCGWVSESKIENEDSLHILESMGMVESFTTKGEPMYIISDRGKRWISLHKENQKKFKSSEIRGWITTTIAVLAFLMTLMAILRQEHRIERIPNTGAIHHGGGLSTIQSRILRMNFMLAFLSSYPMDEFDFARIIPALKLQFCNYCDMLIMPLG